MAEEQAAASFTPTLEPGDTPPWREPVAHHVLYHSMGQYVDRLIERMCDLEKKVAEMERDIASMKGLSEPSGSSHISQVPTEDLMPET